MHKQCEWMVRFFAGRKKAYWNTLFILQVKRETERERESQERQTERGRNRERGERQTENERWCHCGKVA